MEILNSKKLFSKIIKYLETEDFFNLCIINKKTFKNFNDNNIWKEKLAGVINWNLKEKKLNYKDQFKIAYKSKNRDLCSICNKFIIKDFYMTLHDCHYGFNKEVSSNINKSDYISYHSDCLTKYKNLILCPLCKYPIVAYHIGFNV